MGNRARLRIHLSRRGILTGNLLYLALPAISVATSYLASEPWLSKTGSLQPPPHWLCPAGPVMIRIRAIQKVFHLLSILPQHTELSELG